GTGYAGNEMRRQRRERSERPWHALRSGAQPLVDAVRARDRVVIHPLGVAAAAAGARLRRRELRLHVAARCAEAKHGVVDAREFRRLDVEPVEVAIEDE